ncbi:MAG: thioesterase domain-containing protein [Ktedonobacteraceae bacterium]
MSYQLQRQGQTTALLALLDSPPPFPGDSPPDDSEWVALLILKASRRLKINLSLSLEDLRKLDVSDQVHSLLKQMAYEDLSKLDELDRSGTQLKQIKEGEEVAASVVHQRIFSFLKIAKAQDQAIQNYPHHIYPGRITLFRAQDKSDHTPLRNHPVFSDPAFGWGDYSTLPIEIYPVPGDHDSIMEDPYVQTLAVQLTNCIVKAEAECTERN